MFRITLALLVLFCLYYIYEPLPFGLENYDGFELVTAMASGGIAHPPGYGLYLELNRWFHGLLSFWDFQPALSMTYFQCFSSFLAILIFIRMIQLWKGSGLLFLFLMMCCNPFTQNLYSVEVYGFLIFLLALSLKLYFFRVSIFPIWLQDLLLGLVIGLMVSHHLSLAPLAALMVYRRCLECGFSFHLILGLLPGPILSLLLNYTASQSIMNPWFDGTSIEAFKGHITAQVYQAAFLDWGFHPQAWQDFISVWPPEIWIFIILSLVIYFRKAESQFNLAILLVLIWPLFIYNIPDISKPLITFYIVVAAIVSCAEIKGWVYIVLLSLSVMHSFNKANTFQFFDLHYKVRSMEQSIKDAHVAVSKNPQLNHVFIGYDSVFGIAYSRHVLRSKESTKMSIFPMWWVSYFPHLGSLKNYRFLTDKKRAEPFHWSGLNESQLSELHSALYTFAQGFGSDSVFPRFIQFEQLKLSLEILEDRNSILYVPSGKPDLMKYLRDLGYGFINRGFWNQIKLEKSSELLSTAIVQRVYLQKNDDMNYFVHLIFLEQIDQELELKLSHKAKVIASKIKVSGQERTFFKLPLDNLNDLKTKLQIFSNSGKLLSTVTLVID